MLARSRLYWVGLSCSSKLSGAPITTLNILTSRQYASQGSPGNDSSAASRRKQITIASDDGRINWGELSTREKAARTTQQSFNLLVILAGMIMTSGVGYFLYLEVFSTDSKTSHFNRAVSRITSDHRCLELLGDRKTIKAYGQSTWNKWTRNRHIASRSEKDRIGTEHFHMHFNVEGAKDKGVVYVHMSRRPEDMEWKYELLALDVAGQQRLYLENSASLTDKKTSSKMFGVRWW